jgi:hypothetical protein
MYDTITARLPVSCLGDDATWQYDGYISATNHKRWLSYAQKHHSGLAPRRLDEALLSLDKSCGFIRKPVGRLQWTWVLLTNNTNWRHYRRQQMYRLDGLQGAECMQIIAETVAQRAARQGADEPDEAEEGDDHE